MKLEICTKTVQNFSGKLRAKFPFPPFACPWYYSSYLFHAFSEILLPERSLVEGEKLQQKETRKEKAKAKT